MKRIIYLIVCMSIISTLTAKNAKQNLRKYWYYRNRLKSFVKISSNFNEAGTNIPASEVYPAENWMGYDDGNCCLNQYISVLATEYRLLKNYNQDYTETAQQLYYALMTLNRLDATAEKYYRNGVTLSGDLNGFIVRDDITNAFFDKYKKDGTEPYFCVNRVNTQGKRLLSPSFPYDINHEMSEDNVIHYLEALSLVNTLVDNETVDGIQVNFKQIAKDISERMITFMYHQSDPVTINYCYPDNNSDLCLPIKYNWYVKNPVTNNYVPQGSGLDGSMFLFSYGLSQAAKFIYVNTSYQPMEYSQFITNEMTKAPLNNLHLNTKLKTYTCIPIPGVTNIFGASLNLLLQGDNYELSLVEAEFGQYKKSICSEISSTTYNISNINWDDYKVRSLCAVGNISPDFISPCLRLILKVNQNSVAKYEHLPLLWSILNNNFDYLTDEYNQLILNLLNTAPDCGPYYFSSTDNGGVNWSSDSRLVWPENLNGALGAGGIVSNRGEFNGLDYMFLHNLYWLAHSTYAPENINPLKINENDINDSYHFYNSICEFIPTIPQRHFGDLVATKKIICPFPISMTGDVNLYAGESIEFLPGFEIPNDGYNFSADISEVTSTNEPVYYHRISLINYNSCLNRLK